MKQSELEEQKLIESLRTLQTDSPRDEQKAAGRKAAYLAEARQLKPTVSTGETERHPIRGWLFTPFLPKPNRQGVPIMNIAMLIVLVFGLVFGGGSVAVSAAQGSMPDSPLYALKMISEQIRVQTAGETEAGFELALQLANRRIEEANYLLQNGVAPDETLLNRLQQQNENCLRLALNLPEDQAEQALLRLQEQLRQQLRTMEGLNPSPGNDAQAARLRIHSTLEKYLSLAELGARDQTQLRQELQKREQDRLNQPENDALRNEQQNEYQQREGQQDGEGSSSGDSSGNSWGEGTPDSSYGPGESQNPWTELTPTPGSGYGPGESQNPWTELTPTPGSGYGLGPGECTTCTPEGKGNGPMP
jgi:hypothetical protein